MSEYHAIELWISDNIPFITFIATALFGLLLWLFNRLFKQEADFAKRKLELEREIRSERTKLEESEISKLVIQIKALVAHIEVLFKKQDNIEGRMITAEKSIEKHLVKCAEREKVLLEIGKKQDKYIEKFNSAIIINDRTDREN